MWPYYVLIFFKITLRLCDKNMLAVNVWNVSDTKTCRHYIMQAIKKYRQHFSLQYSVNRNKHNSDFGECNIINHFILPSFYLKYSFVSLLWRRGVKLDKELNPRTAGGLSHPSTAGRGGRPPPPPENSKTKKDSNKR